MIAFLDSFHLFNSTMLPLPAFGIGMVAGWTFARWVWPWLCDRVASIRKALRSIF